MEHLVEENLKAVRQQMDLACQTSGRKIEDVKLLLATKTVPLEKLQMAIQMGETLFGENKAQELRDKFPLMRQSNQVEWHFIGHLQTNKVKDVVKYVTLIHSVDRLKLGQDLNHQLVKENKTMDILVQINTSYEESKFGASPETALELVEQLSQFETLNVKGLMTIGKLNATNDETRHCFRLLKSIQTQVREKKFPRVEMDILSMGMSGDFKVAIEEGATIIRVGTSVFGQRYLPDSYYWNENARQDD
ncbi:YggS family pyridoxal phosphate-dependent enzyme [Paenibacillus alvei]|uniref:Pyridoxal phosphate homeostasis protein n=1 Tax=Paenibacillus alvei TaxID=44250 RepID=A0ABT4GYK3_PAEAL|nr:YggS family pyridoxal phosphate-dependent enzyme [Paenibacillus alvei]EJW20188.1 pyridoxal phosphate enzyme, YggS family [Paenibacillus alvei DSM 29]MCY9539561.1 YggS family pyridoxal phosphate-dependent enzyme [Paenibacillus alvei]MCY9704009.1 YggS family pyridoxal phosphate-dependent enzyme [Paenibacillus alvei]MCY9734006.1 YggS family pyridoxal phosphate-dependent enzyme [Paenibacillus alvei]MCY9753816.1 YggS family pyridoxal phosphate-dependent enzyme [Paenibacillus alvei]